MIFLDRRAALLAMTKNGHPPVEKIYGSVQGKHPLSQNKTKTPYRWKQPSIRRKEGFPADGLKELTPPAINSGTLTLGGSGGLDKHTNHKSPLSKMVR